METNTVPTNERMSVPSKEDIGKDLDLSFDNKAGTPSQVNTDLDEKAEKNVMSLLSFENNDVDKQEEVKGAVENLGLDIQQSCGKESPMMQQQLKDLSSKSDDGGNVANALTDLRMQVEDLDPNKLDLKSGWMSRAFGWIPAIGTPMKKYFTRYESAQTVINSIVNSLTDGKEMLRRDNITLVEDQKNMKKKAITLKQVIEVAQLMDDKFVYKLDRDIKEGDPRRGFVEDELLFPLRQRTMDLQQILAVNQQGILSFELIIRNNKELIKGVDRALNVTVNALKIAVVVAQALANQKIVLDKVNALTQTTNNLIAGTARQLKQQGVEIQKQASSSALNMETLKGAFKDINDAMEDISTFRKESLPKMAEAISEMNTMTKTAEDNIDKMGKGNKAQGNMELLSE